MKICENVPGNYQGVCGASVGITLEFIYKDSKEKARDLCLTGANVDRYTRWNCLTGILGIVQSPLYQLPKEMIEERKKFCELIPDTYHEIPEYIEICGQ
jgi:hypothetical protein